MSISKRGAFLAVLAATLSPVGALGSTQAQTDQSGATIKFVRPQGQKREMQAFERLKAGDCKEPFFNRAMASLGNPILPDRPGPIAIETGERFYLLGSTVEGGATCLVSGSFIPEKGRGYTASIVITGQFTSAHRCTLHVVDDGTGEAPASYVDHSQQCRSD